MSKKIPIEGEVIGRWTVIHQIFGTEQTLYKCICVCGTAKTIRGQALRQGRTSSCGCLRRELEVARTLPAPEKKRRRAERAKVKDKTPKRRADKNAAQLKYQISDKAAIAQFRRWSSKKNKPTKMSDEDVIQFRKSPCHRCGAAIQRTGTGFELINPRGPLELVNLRPTCGTCKLIKPKEKFNAVDFSRNTLRRFWKRTPMAQMAKQKARVAIGRFRCAACEGIFKEKETQIDHILPVVNISTGFVSLDDFANRLFCDESNLQILCLSCHKLKTKNENHERKAHRDNKPEKPKKQGSKKKC